MSIGLLDVIDLLPDEAAARLESDSFFADIPVIVADDGNVEAEIERKQAVVTSKSGKRGIAVIILQIEADDLNPSIPFGPLRLRLAFQVVENRELNMDAKGTGKSARRVARRIIMIMKPLRLVGICNTLVPDKPCIESLSFENKKLIGEQVNFYCDEADEENITRVEQPRFSLAADAVTITCATAGASIYYTTDDTFPRQGNGTLYAAPVAVPLGGFTLRACAYKDPAIPSDVPRQSFVHS